MTVSSSYARFLVTFCGALALSLIAAASASAIDNGDEAKCQLGTSLEIGKFIRAKGQCLDSCQHHAFEGSGNAADCVPPYGGSTAGCVTSSEAESGGKIQKSCAQDCPECYSGGDCSVDADARIDDAELHVEALAADIFCDDSASADGLTLSEHKCARTVRKFVTQFAAAKIKCYAKCRKDELSGKIAAGSCTPPSTDAKTQACIDKWEAKTAFVINTSRGGVINEPDLVRALKEGVIAGAGLDVFDQEPIPPGNELLSLPNVILTPHTAALTEECVTRMAVAGAERVVDLFDGFTPDNVANPEVLSHERWKHLKKKGRA